MEDLLGDGGLIPERGVSFCSGEGGDRSGGVCVRWAGQEAVG